MIGRDLIKLILDYGVDREVKFDLSPTAQDPKPIDVDIVTFGNWKDGVTGPDGAEEDYILLRSREIK